MNKVTKAGLVKPELRQHITLSTAVPTDEDAWIYALEFGRSDTKSWQQRVSVFPLNADHKRDPLIGNSGTFKAVASASLTDNKFRQFFYEDLTMFRSSEHLKKPGTSLKFDKNGVRFCAFEQDDVLLTGDTDFQATKMVPVNFDASHFIALCDCVREVNRYSPVEIATDGKGLVRFSTENDIGRYEFFMPTIPSGKKEPSAEGYRAASEIYCNAALDKAA